MQRLFESPPGGASKTENEAEDAAKGSKVGRRRFIKLAAGTVAGTALLFAAEKLRVTKIIRETKNNHKEYREKLQTDYEKTGELPLLEARTRLILLQEWETYLNQGGQNILFSDFEEKYQVFLSRTAEEVSSEEHAQGQKFLEENLPFYPGLGELLKLKSAFQKSVGTVYNKENDTLAG